MFFLGAAAILVLVKYYCLRIPSIQCQTKILKARRLIEIYLYKVKNANGIPRSQVIKIQEEKPNRVPILVGTIAKHRKVTM